MLCYKKEELEDMYKQAKKEELLNAIRQKGYSLEHLRSNKSKMQEIVDEVRNDLTRRKDEIEIFVALFWHLGMYPEGSSVCFVLKDTVDPRKTLINTVEFLKASIKESDATDFGVMSGSDLRQFQLKQYKFGLNTDELFAFIEKNINHYGKGLGETNLLILLQSSGTDVGEINWGELNEKIGGIGLEINAEIMVSYNENNEYHVINVVYPEVGTCRVEISKFE